MLQHVWLGQFFVNFSYIYNIAKRTKVWSIRVIYIILLLISHTLFYSSRVHILIVVLLYYELYFLSDLSESQSCFDLMPLLAWIINQCTPSLNEDKIYYAVHKADGDFNWLYWVKHLEITAWLQISKNTRISNAQREHEIRDKVTEGLGTDNLLRDSP